MFDKKVTTDLIEEYLQKMGLPHRGVEEQGEQEGVVVSPLPTPDGQVYMLLVDPIVERNLLRFRVSDFMKAPLDETPVDRLAGLLLAMTSFNYRIPIGAFAFDPRDGEVVLTCGIPINSNDLRYEDFEHVVGMLGVVMGQHAADLKAVAEGTKQAEDLIG
jgi:hypothetical protein